MYRSYVGALYTAEEIGRLTLSHFFCSFKDVSLLCDPISSVPLRPLHELVSNSVHVLASQFRKCTIGHVLTSHAQVPERACSCALVGKGQWLQGGYTGYKVTINV